MKDPPKIVGADRVRLRRMCLPQGNTRDSAIKNIADAIEECQAVLRKKVLV